MFYRLFKGYLNLIYILWKFKPISNILGHLMSISTERIIQPATLIFDAATFLWMKHPGGRIIERWWCCRERTNNPFPHWRWRDWILGGGNFDDSRSIVARISTPSLAGDKWYSSTEHSGYSDTARSPALTVILSWCPIWKFIQRKLLYTVIQWGACFLQWHFSLFWGCQYKRKRLY